LSTSIGKILDNPNQGSQPSSLKLIPLKLAQNPFNQKANSNSERKNQSSSSKQTPPELSISPFFGNPKNREEVSPRIGSIPVIKLS